MTAALILIIVALCLILFGVWRYSRGTGIIYRIVIFFRRFVPDPDPDPIDPDDPDVVIPPPDPSTNLTIVIVEETEERTPALGRLLAGEDRGLLDEYIEVANHKLYLFDQDGVTESLKPIVELALEKGKKLPLMLLSSKELNDIAVEECPDWIISFIDLLKKYGG